MLQPLKDDKRPNAVLADVKPGQKGENKLANSLRERQRVEEAFRGEWKFTTVEIVKRNGGWYAHFVLKRVIKLPDEPETVIAINRGEHNLAVATES